MSVSKRASKVLGIQQVPPGKRSMTDADAGPKVRGNQRPGRVGGPSPIGQNTQAKVKRSAGRPPKNIIG